MSRGPEEVGRSRPRRPAEDEGKEPANPPRAPVGGGKGGSTFRPNPARPEGKASPGSNKARGAREASRGSGYVEPVAAGPKWYERIVFGSVSSGQLAQFCRQFASYLHAGVDYNKTFSSLQEQFAGTALGPV